MRKPDGDASVRNPVASLPQGWLLLLTVLAWDQGIKYWMVSSIGSAVVTVLPGLLQWRVVYNTGAAWSVGGEHAGLLRIVVTLLVVGLFALAIRLRYWPLWIITGAAASNLWDRWQRGAVTDYIELTFIQYPIFNLADILIVVSALWLGCLIWRKQA